MKLCGRRIQQNSKNCINHKGKRKFAFFFKYFGIRKRFLELIRNFAIENKNNLINKSYGESNWSNCS